MQYLNYLNWLLGNYQHLVNFLIAAFWAVYVIFTVRTFREIRRQTELQSEAFLLVSCELVPKEKEKAPHPRPLTEMDGLYDKWLHIITANIPTARQQEQALILRLQNKGRSDITWWQIRMGASVEPGEYLASQFNIRGEHCEWTIELEGYKDLIATGQSIDLFAARSGVFPRIRYSWTIEYRDMRGVSHSRFWGDKIYVDRNVLADPRTPPPMPPAPHTS